MIYQLKEKKVEFKGKQHFVADTATLIGDIVLNENVSIWFGVVIRGDERITIGANTNIQDGAVLHTDPGKGMKIGKGVTVGHRAVLHGSEIGDNTLIGINAVVLDGVKIGENCVIGANSLVSEGTTIPNNSVVMGSPAKVVKEVKETHEVMLKKLSNTYVDQLKNYVQNLKIQN